MRDIVDYTNEYLKEDFEQYQVYYRRKNVLKSLRKYNHKRILEIGCGMEPLFTYIDNEYDKYVIVEPSNTFCDNAVLLKEDRDNLVIFNGCLEDCIEKIGQENDFVICSSLLHEVENPDDLLEKLAAVCNKDTVIHINVPNAKSIHRLIAVEMGLIDDMHTMSERNIRLQQHSVYNMDELIKCIEKAGFQVVEKGSYFVKPFSHTQMYDMLKKNIIAEEVLMGLEGLVKYLPDFGSEIYINMKLS